MPSPQIVGLMLVKNEDIYIELAVRNCVKFCDLLIIADDGSEDQTPSIVLTLAKEFDNIQVKQLSHFSESQALIESYANTKTWIFAVDGDEIYDPNGLAVLREDLLSGKYDNCWRIMGNVLHCKELDLGKGVAKGYMAPPALSMTKLYNFEKIQYWTNCPQRLHRGKICYNSNNNLVLRLCDTLSWRDATFRCIHLVFMRRSSTQVTTSSWCLTRYNPSEIKRNTQLDWSLGVRHVIKQIFVYPLTRIPGFDYKNRRYRKGPSVELNVSSFFSS